MLLPKNHALRPADRSFAIALLSELGGIDSDFHRLLSDDTLLSRMLFVKRGTEARVMIRRAVYIIHRSAR